MSWFTYTYIRIVSLKVEICLFSRLDTFIHFTECMILMLSHMKFYESEILSGLTSHFHRLTFSWNSGKNSHLFNLRILKCLLHSGVAPSTVKQFSEHTGKYIYTHTRWRLFHLQSVFFFYLLFKCCCIKQNQKWDVNPDWFIVV
jgi:hypothetical protein